MTYDWRTPAAGDAARVAAIIKTIDRKIAQWLGVGSQRVAKSPYGRCPICGADGIRRERRLNGSDECENRHTYPSKDAVHTDEASPFEPTRADVLALARTTIHQAARIAELESQLAASRHSVPNMPQQSTPTNCFRACVAGLLQLPITAVPLACDGDHWDWAALQDWLQREHSLQAIEVTFCDGASLYPVAHPVLCILTGPSPRECVTGRHAVVAKLLPGLEGFEILHDPHASGAGLAGEPTHAVFFVPIAIAEDLTCPPTTSPAS